MVTALANDRISISKTGCILTIFAQTLAELDLHELLSEIHNNNNNNKT